MRPLCWPCGDPDRSPAAPAIRRSPSRIVMFKPIMAAESRRRQISIQRGRSLAAGLLWSWNRRGVDVELVEPPIRVVPSAVRVVGPGRMRDPAVEREARVITIVDVVTRVMRVRRSRADLNVLGERLSAVRAEGSPELRVIIRHAIGVSGTTGSQIVSRVVPHDRDLPSSLIE